MRISNEKDIEILDALRSERAMGFRMLFDIYYMPLCLYSVEICDDFDTAEDIVQNFFVGFWEKRTEDNIGKNLRQYLFSSIRNNTLNHLRKTDKSIIRNIGNEQVISNSQLLYLSEDADEELLRQREKELYDALLLLSANEREAITLTAINGMTYKDASSDMGISINTLKTHLKRAVKKLRDSNIHIALLFVI